MPVIMLPSLEAWAGMRPKGLNYDVNITATGPWSYTMFSIPRDRIYQITTAWIWIISGAASTIGVYTWDGDGIEEVAAYMMLPVVNTLYGGVVNVFGGPNQIVQLNANVTTQPCHIYGFIAGLLYKAGEGVLD